MGPKPTRQQEKQQETCLLVDRMNKIFIGPDYWN